MVRNLLTVCSMTVLFAAAVSCKKNADAVDEYAITDTTGVLKDAADVPVGVGVRLDWYAGDAAYADIVRRHFNSVTFENELKHAAVVSNEGAMDFTRADEFVNQARSAGLQIHGHTLVGFQNTNATFFRSLTASGAAVNVVPNPGFETGSGNSFGNWTTQVGPGAAGSFEAETAAPFAGSRSLMVNVITPGPQQYSMQAYSDMFVLTPGQTYTLTFYAKAAAHGSRFKAILQNTTYQEKTFFITQNWEKYTWNFTAGEQSLSLKFHFPFSGVFYFDDISLPRPTSGTFTIDPVKVDSAMKRFIQATVSRYNTQITAWDVVNEPFEDGTGKLRTNPQPGASTGNNFYFADILGSDYIARAFRYAAEANPNAVLYINEDKLESDGAKLDSMVSLVNRLKSQGVPIHGIGVQMHLTLRNDRDAIETAFKKLAATGLKIRISEMDVRVNPYNYFNYKPTQEDLVAQRDLYRAAIGAYYKHVPAAQRAGITVWDPVDKYSWIVVNQGKSDAPALFNNDYQKKPAYYGVLVGLKRK